LIISSILQRGRRADIQEGTSAAPKERLSALTSLRFFAAALIVVYHSLKDFGLDPNDICKKLALDQGVSCFFVLSGFILSYSYPILETMPKTQRFFLARFARIWPAHLVCFVLVVMILGVSVWQPVGGRWPWITLANVSMLQAWIPQARSYFSLNAPSWSISNEMFFYLCFPVLISRWNETWRQKMLFCAMAVLGCQVVALALKSSVGQQGYSEVTHWLLYINPLARLFEFVLGMFAFGIYQRYRTKGIRQVTSLEATLLECVALALISVNLLLMPTITNCWSGHPTDQVVLYWMRYAGGAPLYAFLIFVLALNKGATARILSAPTLVLLGEISYSLYLIHWIVLQKYNALSDQLAGVPNIVLYIVYWLVICAASYINYLFVESYFRRKIFSFGERHILKDATT
jgi:peptidoglycan/LPS O-acetylase OafA/YrhL